MKYIIREKQKIFRGWNTDAELVTTPSLSDAAVYDTQDDAQKVLTLDKVALGGLGGPELTEYEIIAVTEKEIFKDKLKGK